MLRLIQIEEIQSLMLRVSSLVEQQKQRSPDFATGTASWLELLEGSLAANRLYQAGRIAAMRSSLLAAEHGQIPVDISLRSRPTRTRVVNAVAARVLREASEVTGSLLGEHQNRLSEGERIAQQVIAVAAARRILPRREPRVDNSRFLQDLRRTLARGDDLEVAVIHLEGVVGVQDALILLDRALQSNVGGG